jgi:hypothetical protein
MSATKEQLTAVLEVLVSMAEVVRTAGEIPAGHLYARMMGSVSLATYRQLEARLVGSGLVEKRGHLLRWVGPQLESE